MSRLFIVTLITLALALCHTAEAQVCSVRSATIQSLRVEINGAWDSDPVVLLGGRNRVEVSFDDLRHDYVRYTYNVIHCTADWQPSNIPESDYMDGFNGSRIEQYTPSMNTTMLYNHYVLPFPNEDVQLKASGNYRVEIFDEDQSDENPVAVVCFSVLEPKVNVGIAVNANTDIDTYASHQQVSLTVNHSTYAMSHPEQELRVVVLQNRRWDNHVTDLMPSSMRAGVLQYEHNRNLIFVAGNEYRRFEIMDEYAPSMRVDRVEYEEPCYHAFVMTDEPRRNYIYDQDQDGRYYPKNHDEEDETVRGEADYVITHFRLEMPPIGGGEMYLHGDLTNGGFSERNRMEYNLVDHAYELTLPLKQGSYNYQYLFVPRTATKGETARTEGNFHQTENEYCAYVYHRPFGARYDRLVGYNKVKYAIAH